MSKILLAILEMLIILTSDPDIGVQLKLIKIINLKNEKEN